MQEQQQKAREHKTVDKSESKRKMEQKKATFELFSFGFFSSYWSAPNVAKVGWWPP